jgi:hypothetical protein
LEIYPADPDDASAWRPGRQGRQVVQDGQIVDFRACHLLYVGGLI